MPPTMSDQERPRAKVWQPWFDQDDDGESSVLHGAGGAGSFPGQKTVRGIVRQKGQVRVFDRFSFGCFGVSYTKVSWSRSTWLA